MRESKRRARAADGTEMVTEGERILGLYLVEIGVSRLGDPCRHGCKSSIIEPIVAR